MKRQVIKLKDLMSESDIQGFTEKINNAEDHERCWWLSAFRRYVSYAIRDRFPGISNVARRSEYILHKQFGEFL